MLPLAMAIPVFLVVINLTTCAAFILDRQAATRGRARINPALLMMCVGLGGGLGMVLALAPGLRTGLMATISPTMLIIVGVQIGVAFGLLAFYVLPIG